MVWLGTIMGADTAGFGRARDLVQQWKYFPVRACSQKPWDCKEGLGAICLLSSMGWAVVNSPCCCQRENPRAMSQHSQHVAWWARLDARSGRYQGKDLPKSNTALLAEEHHNTPKEVKFLGVLAHKLMSKDKLGDNKENNTGWQLSTHGIKQSVRHSENKVTRLLKE